MIRLSWSTFAERWQLFVGAFVAVAVGVALVEASLLTVAAAATPDIPDGLSYSAALSLRESYSGAVGLAAMGMALTFFVAAFVVASTFAFTVAQRRRDFALLRLTGATPRQVRRLLLGEALTLGVLGAGAGIALGWVLARLEAAMFERFGFVPVGFIVRWRWWAVSVAIGVGLAVAVVGCLGASRRAGRVRALDALRDVDVADRVMTRGRWFVGLLAGAAATWFVVSSATADGPRAMDAAMPACMLAVLALCMLAPVVVPAVAGVAGWLVATLLPGSRLGSLVLANLRDGVRRSASTAAPVILLVGLVVGLAGTVHVIDAGRRVELERSPHADLVVETVAPVGTELAAVEGVRGVAEEVPLVIEVPEADAVSYDTADAVAIDPDAYPAFHSLHDGEAALRELAGDTVALAADYAASLGVAAGDTVDARIDGRPRSLRVVSVLAATMNRPDVMLAVDSVPAGEIPRRYLLRTDDDTSPSAVAARVRGELTVPAEVVMGEDWIERHIDDRRRTSQNIILTILGLVTVYLVIAVVNAVVIAGADREREFAVARLSGLTRGQVLLVSLSESLVVCVIGIALGAVGAALTFVGVTMGVSDVVGAGVVAVPWRLALAAAIGAIVLVAVTNLATTAAATRAAPIAVAAARE